MKIYLGLKKEFKELLKVGDIVYVENLTKIICLKTITRS